MEFCTGIRIAPFYRIWFCLFPGFPKKEIFIDFQIKFKNCTRKLRSCTDFSEFFFNPDIQFHNGCEAITALTYYQWPLPPPNPITASSSYPSGMISGFPLTNYNPSKKLSIPWSSSNRPSHCEEVVLAGLRIGHTPVSYTHLTLPTIYSV